MFGKREETVMTVVNYIDNYRRCIQFYLEWLFSKDLRKEMTRNKKFKNSHQGKRCFIIGNGPSLKHYDLTKLTEEYVFTVNYMMKSTYFNTLRPNYHFLVDPNVFKLNTNSKPDKNKIQAIHKAIELNPEMEFFIPFNQKSSSSTLLPGANVHYLYNNKIFTKQVKKPYTLYKNIPIFQNVILYAINTAIYMGFNEIYLLGVDMTGFLENFEYNKINEQWGHAYNKTLEEIEIQIKNRAKNYFDNEFYLKAYGKTFEHFKLTKDIVSQINVELINASSHGALDVFRRINFDNIK